MYIIILKIEPQCIATRYSSFITQPLDIVIQNTEPQCIATRSSSYHFSNI